MHGSLVDPRQDVLFREEPNQVELLQQRARGEWQGVRGHARNHRGHSGHMLDVDTVYLSPEVCKRCCAVIRLYAAGVATPSDSAPKNFGVFSS